MPNIDEMYVINGKDVVDYRNIFAASHFIFMKKYNNKNTTTRALNHCLTDYKKDQVGDTLTAF